MITFNKTPLNIYKLAKKLIFQEKLKFHLMTLKLKYLCLVLKNVILRRSLLEPEAKLLNILRI